jgi:hypothetical protein
MTPLPFRIIPCSEWGARLPKSSISNAGHFDKAIFHHTAGHHAEISGPADESYEEARRYARSVQNYHMDGNGWQDSGHNFLVTRNGYIFEGRHRSLELLQSGQCPVSAHCPTQNGNPGVEIEHVDPEAMTPIQRRAAVWLFAQLCKKGGFGAERIKGHRDYWATSCPSSLYPALPAFRDDVAIALRPPPAPVPKYRIKLRAEDGKEYVFDDVRYPGNKLKEFGIIRHKIVQGWIERK